jgi:3-dehydroquinate synthase
MTAHPPTPAIDTLTVSLAERSYPIHFGADLAAIARPAIDMIARAGRRIAIVTDSNLARAQAPALHALFAGAPVLELSPGEETKTLSELGCVLDFMAAQRLDRASVLVAAGGGVIGDLAGFAAASYLRGIDFLQIPTTLLSMVDSSVGGKTGVNLLAGKNLVGAFHQPRAVFIATGKRATLPARDLAAGMAEVIKYGLLADAALFAQLERVPLTPASPALAPVIRRCCEIKARIVESDERELAREGGRALLNLGHTFGHAIEQASGYGVYLHGEAVAIGLAAAARLSEKLALIPAAGIARGERALEAHALPVRLRDPLPMNALMTAMTRDKKARASVLRFVVMNQIGDSATRSDIAPALVGQVWREVGAA